MNIDVLDSRQSLADLLRDLGEIPPERVRRHPPPGTATIQDLLKPGNSLCELIDGTLVEKPMGIRESVLTLFLVELLHPVIRKQNLGVLSGADGPYELLSGLVRMPDIAFVSWGRLPGRRLPEGPMADVVPDLAIEVLSASNTKAEMSRKRREYFEAGVREVWEINPRTRSASVYTGSESGTDHDATGTITTPLLPGFTLTLAELFAELDRQG